MTQNDQASALPYAVHTAPQIQFIKLQQVCSMTALSRPSIYRLAANDAFPKPRKLGVRASAWVLSEVQAWLVAKAA